MVWLQALSCFVLWVGYGVWMRRTSDALRDRMKGSSRRKRTLLGSAGLILGLVILGAGLLAVNELGGLGPNGLEPWAWLAVAVLGTVFVHLQVLGAAAMLSLVLEEVTTRPSQPSVNQEQEPS